MKLDDVLNSSFKPTAASNINVVEYNGHLIVVENNRLKYDLDEITTVAMRDFVYEQLNIALRKKEDLFCKDIVSKCVNIIQYTNKQILILKGNKIEYEIDQESFEAIKEAFREKYEQKAN